MDLRTNQDAMGVQNRFSKEYESHGFKAKEIFQEADIRRNNNIFISLKTEANSNNSHDPSSLEQVKCSNKKKLEVDNSLFSYSSFKKAMDLRTHNRTLDGERRTIFDDAENFAKNHRYKLLPITFEQVDETIIQSEHNYCLFSLTSESETEEDCSRMMDYTQIKEKNYKRRRTKYLEESEEAADCGSIVGDGTRLPQSPAACDGMEGLTAEPEDLTLGPQSEKADSVQPLDLSGASPAEDEKTDPSVTPEEKNDEIARLDSDKENVDVEVDGIRVTITRPDEKENYQPCDLFLNDIARLVPWLIDKDCLEVDILDRTCDGRDDLPRHRLYYVISESTWRLFQTSNERVILTNDQSLGQPVRKAEKDERASYLVFDQFSLAKCLAEYCQEIGGCFEYTCVDGNEEEDLLRDEREVLGKTKVVKVNEVTVEEKEVASPVQEKTKQVEEFNEALQIVDEISTKATAAVKEEKEEETEEVTSNEVLPKAVESTEAGRVTRNKAGDSVGRSDEKISFTVEKIGGVKEIAGTQTLGQVSNDSSRKRKGKKGEQKGAKEKIRPFIQPKPKNRQMTTRSKSASESETSQNSDERASGKEKPKRGGEVLPKLEPPSKMLKSVDSKDSLRRTRSGKVLQETKTTKAAVSKESAGSMGTRQRRQASRVEKKEGESRGRNLRSQVVAQRKEEEKRGKESARATSASKSKRKKR